MKQHLPKVLPYQIHLEDIGLNQIKTATINCIFGLLIGLKNQLISAAVGASYRMQATDWALWALGHCPVHCGH